MTKACKACDEIKPLDEYYRHRMMGDGHLNFCKACVKSRVKQKRWSDIDAAREYDAKRAARRKLDPAYYDQRHEQRRQYRSNYPEKNAAHKAVQIALRKGILTRKPCEYCGSERFVHAHHDDYAKPLEIMWLCVIHHRQRHRELEAA